MNGTNAQNLMEPLKEACGALAIAIEKLKETHPHGRDYYVITDLARDFTFSSGKAISVAQEAHRVRMNRLIDTHQELMDIWLAIDDQVKK
jgi:hypothetical protein